jgi:hypothetical protein
MIRNNPNTTIGEALGEGKMWECEEKKLPSSIRDSPSSEATLFTYAHIENAGELGTEDEVPEPKMDLCRGRTQ